MLAGCQVDAVDPAPGEVGGHVVAGRGVDGHEAAVGPHRPVETAVVGHVDRAVGADGRAVCTAVAAGAQLGHHLDRTTTGRHAAERAALHLDEEHGAVGQRDGALGESQTIGDDAVRRRFGDVVRCVVRGHGAPCGSWRSVGAA